MKQERRERAALARDRQISKIQSDLRDPSKRYAAIYAFRSKFPTEGFLFAFHRLFSNRSSLQEVHGQPFPSSPKNLFAKLSLRNQVTAYREFLWALGRFSHFKDELRAFCELRYRFEEQVLVGDHSGLLATLADVETQFGTSIWLLQNRIASSHLKGSGRKPAEVASAIVRSAQGNQLLHLLLNFIQRRIEGALLRDDVRREISDSIPESLEVIRDYIRGKTYDITDASDTTVAALLHYDAQASLIDHYDSFVHSLQAAASDRKFNAGMIATLQGPLRTLRRNTGDERLDGVLRSFGIDIAEACRNAVPDRDRVVETYTTGDYSACVAFAQTYLHEHPRDSAIRIICAKASVASGIELAEDVNLLSEMNRDLCSILAADKDFFRSTHSLLVLADRFYDHSWMTYLRVCVLYEIGPEDDRDVPVWLSDTYVRDPHLTPFSALVMPDPIKDEIARNPVLAQRFPHTVCLLRDILAGASATSKIPAPRVNRYLARKHLSHGRYREAADMFVAAAASEGKANRTRALGGASLALALSGRLAEAIDTIVNALLENPFAPTLLPFSKLYSLLAPATDWPNTLNLGIFLQSVSEFAEDTDLSRQRLAFEKFCDSHQIFTPEALESRREEFGATNVIAYLERVWRPEVMRQTLLYRNSRQIEEARINACQVLARLDSANADRYLRELAARVKQQEISKGTVLVDQSRVYVDIAAIKRNLRSRLGTSYAQYKSSLSQLQKPTDELVDQLRSALSDVRTASLPTLLSHLTLLGDREAPTQSEVQFNVLFSEVTKEFLKGDHGLNAYLSTRVRHGKLVDALRKPVADEHLVTAKIDETTYARNTYWETHGIDQMNAVVEELNAFASEFDSILAFVRDRLIQIKIVEDLKDSGENPDGLFRYVFSSLERRLMQRYDFDYRDFDEFITRCVDILWEKTDLNLDAVRAHLGQQVRAQIIGAFDSLSHRLSCVSGAQAAGPLANSIARAKTATQQALDLVIAWFRRSEVYDRQDFDAILAPQIAFNILGRTLSLPNNWKGPVYIRNASDAPMPGRTLDGMVDIFYVLFENAVKYAERENLELAIAVTLTYEDSRYRCEVTSSAGTPTNEQLEHLRQVRETLATQESRRLAQSEGRSGFRKIWLALDNPFYRNPQLRFEHKADGKFEVIIEFCTGDAS